VPFFKTTYNILIKSDEDELFNENWMDSDKLILPVNKKWDYKREMEIEDVDIWEVIYQASGGIGVYAAYDPYAEFYMITSGFTERSKEINNVLYCEKIIETHYGGNVQQKVQKRINDLKIPISLKKIWVDPEEMWLY
jgi:hypothetical protein